MTDPFDQYPGCGYVFGRDRSCDVRVDDEYVSPRHCRVWQDANGDLWVVDLGSTNGTWIGRPGFGRRVYGQPHKLAAGEKLCIGRTAIPWNGAKA